MTVSSLLVSALRYGCDFSEDRATELASSIIEWSAAHGHAGVSHYWPVKFSTITAEERNAEIRRRFNGKNLSDLCREYGISHETVYRAVR